MFEDNDPIGGFLFIGLYIILASTGLSIWLRELSRKLKPQFVRIATQGSVGVGDVHEQQ
jgi:hypothetical protein